MPNALRRVALFACLLACLAPAARAAVSPNARVLPMPNPCDVGPANASRHLTEDASGVLWVIAHCTGQVAVTISHDGGQTWEPFVQVWPQGVAVVAIQGGTLPGHAIAAWQSFTGDVITRVTTDFGATWSPAATLFAQASAVNGMSLVAEADRYHVMAFSSLFASALVRTSPNRGATWNTLVSLPMTWAYGDLAYDAASDQLELVADTPSFVHRVSANHGASFSPQAPLPGGCCLNYSDWAIGGGRTLYGAGNQPTAWRIDLGAASATAITGLFDALPAQRSIDADALGGGFVATREQGIARTVLQRIAPASSVAGAPIVLDNFGDNPNVLACDGGSAAVTWRGPDGLLWFDKSCADGTWTCCTAEINEPPACAAGGPYVAECGGTATFIDLNGGASSDPEGAVLTFAWTTDCPGGTFDDAASPTPRLMLDSAGCDVACGVTLQVSDGALGSACTAMVSVSDTTAPALWPYALTTVRCLWPPNHRMVEVAIPARALLETADLCDPAPAVRLVGCVSDQPDDATGDGRTEGDCVVAPDGQSVLARAERDGARSEGRTYALFAVATDACGNAGAPVLIGNVRVPHDADDLASCYPPPVTP